MPSNITYEAMQKVLREVECALGEIQFGSLEITLHDGYVTQIERRERTRFASERTVKQVHTVKAR